MIRNVSGTFEEAARILAGMSSEERGEFCRELFKYDAGSPVSLIEDKADEAEENGANAA